MLLWVESVGIRSAVEHLYVLNFQIDLIVVAFLPVLDLSLLYSSRENGVSVVVRVDEYRLEVCKLDVDFENEIGLVDAAFVSLHVFSCCLLAFLASFDFHIFVHSLL